MFNRFLVAVTLLVQTGALFEEQAGVHDWYQMNLGHIQHFAPQKRTIILGSSSSMLASLKTETGGLVWRQALPEGETLDFMRAAGKKLLTLSAGGETVRLWSAHDGSLLWDSNSFRANTDTQHLAYNLKPDVPETPASSVKLDAIHLEGKVVVVLVGNTVTVRQMDDGAVLWSFTAPTGHSVLALSADDTAGDVHVVCSKDTDSKAVVIFSLSAMTGEQDEVRTIQSKSAVSADRVAAVSGVLVMLDIEDKSISLRSLSTEDSSSEASSSPNKGVVMALSDPVLLTDKEHRDELLASLGAGELSFEHADLAHALILKTQKHRHLLHLRSGESEDDISLAHKCTRLGECAMYLNQLQTIANDEIQQLFLGGANGPHAHVKNNNGVVSVTVIDGDMVLSLATDLDLKGRGLISHGLLSSTKAKNNGSPYKVVLSFADHSLALIQDNKVVWVREEALASIKQVEFFDLASPLSDQGFPAFPARVFAKVELVVNKVKEVMTSINDLFVGQPRARGERSAAVPGERLHQKHEMEKDVFGCRKVVISLSTKANKLIALDSSTGDIVWSHYFGTDARAVRLLRTSARNVGVVMESNGVRRSVQEVNSFTGELLESTSFDFELRDIIAVPVREPSDSQHFAMIGPSMKVAIYPTQGAEAAIGVFEDGLFFHRTEIKKGTITGYLIKHSTKSGFMVSQQWMHVFPADVEQISAIATTETGEIIQDPVRNIGDRAGKLHKYLNPHLLAVATVRTLPTEKKKLATKRVSDPSVNLYLIDGVTGDVVERLIHRNGQGPVHVVATENLVVYHYYNSEQHQYEVSVIELYEDRKNLAMAKEAESDVFSSFSAALPSAVQQTYVLRSAVKGLTVSRTRQGITDKLILVSLASDSVLGLARQFLDPRRPTGEPTANDKAEGLMPYTMEVPSAPVMMVSQNRTIANLRGVVTEPTTLESTSLVFAFGTDLFSSRVMPSKTFDQLSPDFNYPFLLATVIAVLVPIPILKHMADAQNLAKAWK